MIRVCPHSDSKCPNGMGCTFSCATDSYDGTKKPMTPQALPSDSRDDFLRFLASYNDGTTAHARSERWPKWSRESGLLLRGTVGKAWLADEARAALAAPGGEGEPVAWRFTDPGDGSWVSTTNPAMRDCWKKHGSDVEPLFTAPPEPVAWRPDRASVARIIDPEAWAFADRHAGKPVLQPEVTFETRRSLTKADTILALAMTAPSPNDLGSSSMRDTQPGKSDSSSSLEARE